jgi:hypothetical protein
LKLFKSLRNPKLAFLLSGIILFVSCSQYETFDNSNENLSVEELQSIHLDLINQFDSQSSSALRTTEEEFNEIFMAEYEKNLDIALNQGVEALFKAKGLDTSLPSTVQWAMDNLENENFYEEIIERENYECCRCGNFVFIYVNCTGC